jgi:hypothetical protein
MELAGLEPATSWVRSVWIANQWESTGLVERNPRTCEVSQGRLVPGTTEHSLSTSPAL